MDSHEELRKKVEEMKESSRHFIELLHHMAKNNWTLYQEYIAQGFTHEQALELVCRTGLSLRGDSK